MRIKGLATFIAFWVTNTIVYRGSLTLLTITSLLSLTAVKFS